MERVWLAAAGLTGMIAVGGDAAARHLLSGDPHRLDLAMIAGRYGLLHAAALVGLAVLSRGGARGAAALWLIAAGWCFVAGVLLFCGSLFLLAAGAPPGFAWFAPFGGIAFILGWAALLLHALSPRRAI